LQRVWGPRPIQNAVVDILQKKGAMTDEDLRKELEEYYSEISFRELNTILMKLEINGVLRVSRLLKKKRRVELVEARSGN
jgi:transcription initiation factor IIE alpha subunit